MKPLLAYTVEDMSKLQFPVLASPKLDGIRCLTTQRQGPVTRSLKPVPNKFIQRELEFYPPLDGELMVGDPLDPTAFNKSTSGIMSHEGEPDFTFWVFDTWSFGGMPFEDRLERVEAMLVIEDVPRVRLVEHVLIKSHDELLEYEANKVGMGYEGVMVRSPKGLYKHGRSTAREGILGKVKRFEDTEGVVVGFEELRHNDNEQTTNNLGYAERSKVSSNMRPGGTLGALQVSASSQWTEDFGIGTGFTAEQRQEIWDNRDDYFGMTVKFKHQPAGAKDKPRFPTFLGWRLD